MSSSEFATESGGGISGFAIRVRDVSKHYVMFERPEDRFKQMIVPRLERLIGRPPRRYFRDFSALSGISFEVGRGETVGIIGRNGSGKSTLLQIICGTLQPTSGSVEVNGRIAALLELGAGFNPEFTGRENVFLNASILGVPRKEMEWRFDDIARFADIGSFIDQPVKTYSSGMYVRLAFATAINVDPDILVVDEALAVGDEAFQRKCFARIEDIKDGGGTILFVSHGAQTIVQLCSRAILLDAGQLISQGRPKPVVNQYQRLLNASGEAFAQTRESILRSAGILEVAKERIAPDPVIGAPSAQPDATDYLDPAMKTQSATATEEHGARIHSCRIQTMAGNEVNVLQLGKRYVFDFKVSFEADATNIAFGMAFRNVTGLILAGAHNSDKKIFRIPAVKSGTTISVGFEFNCLMLPGVYFVGCSVFGSSSFEQNIMHRVVDSVMLRIAAEPDLLASGYFDLSPMIRVETL
ncbi:MULTISPECIES: ABC transporter ATP-binding protein [unclassified Mesorhizobium]|uniref:ABC transporter ATP-binding protein n=1 Tax=unclassified Mesorhizobium TaxID=325217 RepID=UPI000FCC6452|nr:MULTISPECIES: ABC transporter ATP-binding protein [unclassified Mesorhizobium]RUY29492.1 ABC transporter ATP-binding protein [Mesorhizobium sp. M7A.F.Ca.US.001.04.2.1]RUY46334.1 ABC transporter ATP-binding protein [Mesorhizobium sp. M7A.F.Ca.US.001.04.1.1]RVA04821.1 ABC transporter ATP-binding protein [Mesorhizobium sp. M7A.F.Ca.US.001.02.1.1]RVA14974.1 ABC transporter ATP-binding protein [Mesorhizobium sp. M7A.F.Ca.US.002.01.1.1]